MYTQCPECGAAFRVTAGVLKQAAGKVRCGACGHAFNALEHLSEEKPEAAASVGQPELPELRPESVEAEPAAAKPQALSPEHSTALLKTLDELSGDDVQLEDTGIEWRLLDESSSNDAAAAPRETLLDEDLSADLEDRRVDELLTRSATPVDEVLSEGGSATFESPEVFADPPGATIPDEELRFDDNTGLPEDDHEDDGDDSEALVVPEPSRDAPEPMANLQVDLGFGDPDDWQDILAEVGPDEAEPDREEPAAEVTLADELDALDIDIEAEEEPSPPADDELVERMEALSLELSGIQEELDELTAGTGERSIIEELDELTLAADDEEPADDDAMVVAFASDDEQEALEASDDFALEEETAPDDEEPGEPLAADDEAAGDSGEEHAAEIDPDETSIDDDLIAAAFEQEAIEIADPDGEDDEDPLSQSAIISIGDLDIDLEASTDDDDAAAPAEPVLLPMTEEEQTVNMQIDEELLALAVEDEDGFASTIVGDKADFDAALAEAEAETEAGAETDEGDADEAVDLAAAFAGAAGDAAVEEIVMEGAYARYADDESSEEEDAARRLEAQALVAESKAAEEAEKPGVNWRLVAGIAVLALILVAQAVHFSRDSLAKIPAIKGLIEPLYNVAGAPLTPAWDVTGWRFEATRGSTNASGDTLSIFTRIGNDAADPLPYPVISVALTDRFEETIGSRVFEPDEYLQDDEDTAARVPPGASFNALMSIESPAVDATGFKLNVCYRLPGRRLRCAVEDFR